MSRIANNPVTLPKGVEVSMAAGEIAVKGAKGSLKMALNSAVVVVQEGDSLTFAAATTDKFSGAMAGTTRSLVNNMVIGCSVGFEKKLELVGVGYRAQVQGSKVNLTLGFSHPIVYDLPQGVTAECPTQTEIVLKAMDKQVLGQAAAEIRAFRPPEPYKGKGVRISGEYVRRKEAKKK
ncbi:50S ribosomal protein L6 [Gammaproteobacteria bacterium LSUCC0057]|uniref:Large ribosomal subunit protein uL6 n=1 Tax=Gammaproteobacteria bacterium LSUCC0057 TaxID=2559237 RepID=A0A4Y8UFW0_9GAMM|nr:50S ribosomal protein L6 [Gammaproteobacteria bacterium LSUCC0057]